MTSQERIRAIAGMGYLPREAEFLCLAALHSGYFLRRQYRRFLDIESGKREQSLIDKLVDRGHARRTRLGSRTQLIHLCSHPFYRRIGQPENRHRRRRSMPSVRIKLMGLDFVLDRLVGNDREKDSLRFLPTEEAKLDFFRGELGIDRSLLPRKVYPSAKGGSSTTRYFVDKLPIFRSGSGAVSFVYIDADSVSCSGFETYLRRHFDLIRALASVRIFFATAEPQKVRWAQRRFRSLFRVDLPVDALLRFFRLEKLYRDRAFDRLPQQSLIELRNARKRFQGAPQVETLFEDWLARGDCAVSERTAPAPGERVQFVPYPMEEDYAFLQ